MRYTSTRDCKTKVTSAQAIARGISPEGGLFVPEEIPTISRTEIEAMVGKTYAERAYDVLSKFLTDFSEEELRGCVTAAYGPQFRNEKVAPLRELYPGLHILELWHGPTCAFKDMALQILPHLMSVASQKTADGKEIVILVATSGDTGKAALEGFKDAPGTKILVFYPEDGVSPMQKLQMVTQEGANVAVCAIKGNFDDAQTGVKTIFTDRAFGEQMAAHGKAFSSANSINWGRLAPQIVYYISAYCDLLADKKISFGDAVNVVVPTGNFGNILAAYYAKRMGLPLGKLICASNANRVLTDFIQTGVYNRNRPFYTTTSPSMDILVSSNLERLLFELSGREDACLSAWMTQLTGRGDYEIPASLRETLQTLFAAGSCDDAQTADTIRRTFEQYRYLLDTHTAVAVNVYEAYRAESGDVTPTVLASTANPYKFAASVLQALGQENVDDEFDKIEQLHRMTGCEIPAPLSSLRDKTPRFHGSCRKEEMEQVVRGFLEME